MDALTAVIRRATAETVARRFTLENERMGKMDRLTEKLNKAAGVVGRATARLEERADLLIAREEAIEHRSERIFGAHHAVLDQGDAGMDTLESKLALLSNDPLESSGESPQVDPATTFRAAE